MRKRQKRKEPLVACRRFFFMLSYQGTMLGIIINLPPAIEHYLAVTPVETMAAQALLLFGWIPVFGVIVWGMTHVWLDYKQEHYNEHLHWTLLEVKVPQTAIQTPKGMENFFANLSGVKSGLTWREIWLLGKEQAYFSFEIVSNGGQISFLIRAQDKYRDIVEADIYAQYPEAQITEVEDYTDVLPSDYPNDQFDVFGAEMVLKKENFYPIRTYDDFEHQGERENRFKDPLLPMLEFMGKLHPNEYLWVQIIIRPPENEDWVKEGLKYLGKIMGKEEKHKTTMGQEFANTITSLPLEAVRQLSGLALGGGGGAEKKADDFRMFKLTSAERIQIDSIAEKVSKIGWRTKIRYVAAGPKGQFRKGMFASGVKGIFAPFTSQILNGFALHGPAVPKDDYIWQRWQMPGKQKKLVSRFKRRAFMGGSTPFILNSEELATLFHFPSAEARTPVLSSLGARRAEAPSSLPYGGEGADIMDWKKRYGGREEKTAEPTMVPGETFHVPAPHAPTAHPAPETPEEPHGEHGHDAEPPANLPI